MEFVVSCEHARNQVPPDTALGVSAELLESHVGWDPGAHEAAAIIAAELKAPLVAGEFTRLVADLNRSPNNPAVVPTTAFGFDIPGNVGLTPRQFAERVARYHRPYWERVRALILQRLVDGNCMHCSVHSFSPDYGTDSREFAIGLLYHPGRPREAALAGWLYERATDDGFAVAHNEPYPGLMDGIAANFRDQLPPRYLPFEIEFSHALLDAPGRLEAAARSVANALATIPGDLLPAIAI